MSSQQQPSGNRLAPVGMLLLGTFIVIDFLAAPMLRASGEGGLPGLMFCGAGAGQLGLLAIWAALGPQRPTTRLLVTLVIAVLLWAVYVLGAIAAERPGPATQREMAQSFLLLPLILLAAQLPLWILKIAIGCRIARGGAEEGSSATGARQFGIRDMLGATTVLAAALGVASLLPRQGGAAGYADPSMWLRMIIGCLVCSVLVALVTVPCLWAVFLTRNKAVSTCAIAAWVLVMTLIATAILIKVAPGGFIGFEAFTAIFLFHVGMTGVTLGTLHVVRGCGYILRRAGRKGPPPPPVTSSTDPDSADALPPPGRGSP